jgi:hypothetical protein
MYQLMWISDAALVVLPLASLCASLIFAWRLFRRGENLTLSRWRRMVLGCGLVGNTASLVLLLSFLALTLLVKHGMSKYAHLLWAFSFLFWIALSLGTVPCGAFGRGISRFLVMANGVVLAFLWYMLGLANSS